MGGSIMGKPGDDWAAKPQWAPSTEQQALSSWMFVLRRCVLRHLPEDSLSSHTSSQVFQEPNSSGRIFFFVFMALRGVSKIWNGFCCPWYKKVSRLSSNISSVRLGNVITIGLMLWIGPEPAGPRQGCWKLLGSDSVQACPLDIGALYPPLGLMDFRPCLTYSGPGGTMSLAAAAAQRSTAV